MWGMWRAAWRDGHWPTCQLLLLLQIPLIPDREVGEGRTVQFI